MPIPKPGKKEDKQNFIQRCMSNETMKKEYPDSDQRLAVCIGQTKSSIFEKMIGFLGWNFEDGCCTGYAEEIDCSNITIPRDEDYEDYEDEDQEEYDFGKMGCGQKGKYEYIDPDTREIYYFDQKRNYKKNNRYLRYVGIAKSAEYQGRKVTLNKPFRTPDGPKKFSVYVKNDKGNVVKVNFGDPNMKIKKNIPERRKSFRARHKCDQQKDKTTPAYWSCKMW